MDVLSIAARLHSYRDCNYLQPYYIEQLESKNIYALHQLPMELVLHIIPREREKELEALQNRLQKKRQSLTLDQRINSSSYWTFVRNNLKHRKKLNCDKYMVSFLIENLQEFTEDGKSVTYEGLDLYNKRG